MRPFNKESWQTGSVWNYWQWSKCHEI